MLHLTQQTALSTFSQQTDLQPELVYLCDASLAALTGHAAEKGCRTGGNNPCLCFLGGCKAGGEASLFVNMQSQHLRKQSSSWSCPDPALVLTHG